MDLQTRDLGGLGRWRVSSQPNSPKKYDEAVQLLADLRDLAVQKDAMDFRDRVDMLRAAQVLTRLGNQCGILLELRTLFESPTVAELANRLRGVTGDAPKHPHSEGIAIRDRRPAADLGTADVPPVHD